MTFLKKRNRGSALILSLGAIFGMTLVVISMLEWSSSEAKLERKSQSYVRAVYDSGSLLEFGLSQVALRVKDNPTLPANEFLEDPLEVPPLNSNFFTVINDAEVIEAELVGGMIPPAISIYIDPDDPINAHDPDKGSTVMSRQVMILSKVVHDGSSVSDSASYSSRIFEIRERPFFSSAAFSDKDFVVLRPTAMRFSGPVHTNGDLIMVSDVGNVHFDGLVTVAGNIRTPSTYSNNFYFRSDDLSSGSPSFLPYIEYSGSDWKNYAESRWNNNLQTGVMGVTKRVPAGFEELNDGPDDNPYHQIIEKPVSASDPSVNQEVEVEKFASKAGVVIEIELTKMNPAYDDEEEASLPPKEDLVGMDPTAYAPPINRDIYVSIAMSRFHRNADLDPSTVNVRAYRYTEDDNGDYFRKDEEGQVQRYSREDITASIPNLYNASFPADPDSIIRSQGPGKISEAQFLEYFTYRYSNYPEPYRTERITTETNDYRPRSGYHSSMDVYFEFITPQIVPDVDTNTPLKLWDARRRKWVHITDLDMGKLKSAVEIGIPGWNGILYVECTDLERTGVRVINAKELPDPDGVGMTLATNNALYIKGSYNADGDLLTGSSTEADNPREVVAAIAADAVTVLSDHWDDRKSRMDVTRFTSHPNQNDRNPVDNVEISAAIMAGMGIFDSGGINNFVRFLELWEGKTVRIRGSLVSLFRSEAAWEPWDVQYVYYPPIRDYGYHEFFKNNQFPPGSPQMRFFVKKARRDISKAEYDMLKEFTSRTLEDSYTGAEEYHQGISDIQRLFNTPDGEISIDSPYYGIGGGPPPPGA